MRSYQPTNLGGRAASRSQRAGYSSQRRQEYDAQRPREFDAQQQQQQQQPRQEQPQPQQEQPPIQSSGQDGRDQLVPGCPHQFGFTNDRRTGFQYSLCRCTDPWSHGDAVTWFFPKRRNDFLAFEGRPSTWIDNYNLILDSAGKECITKAEVEAQYPRLLNPRAANLLRAAGAAQDRYVIRGGHVDLPPAEFGHFWRRGDRN